MTDQKTEGATVDKIEDAAPQATEAPEATPVALDVGADLGDASVLRASETNFNDKAIRRTRTIATIILIILILVILAACATMFALLRPQGLGLGGQTRAGITWIRSIYGHGTVTEDLINPSSVAFAADGQSVWVTDSARHRLVQYDLNGRLLSIVNADWRVNEMIFPSRIAISPQGWFYVAEQTYNRVQIFDSNWNHQETIHLSYPTAVAANDEVLGIGSRRGFAVFSYRGEPIGMHAADSEDEINRFDYVSGIVFDNNNNAYVLDAFNNRLVKYNPEGVPQFEVNLGFPGNEGILGGRNEDQQTLTEQFPAGMQLPQGITMDAAGRINIIDMFDFSVGIFDAETGDFIRKVGQQGTQDGSLHNPNCIDYNPTMDMFASAEASLGRVQLFSIEGSSGDTLTQLRRQFSDFLNACCIPLLIILIIIAAYLVSRALAKKRREKELQAALVDPDDPNTGGGAEVSDQGSGPPQQT